MRPQSAQANSSLEDGVEIFIFGSRSILIGFARSHTNKPVGLSSVTGILK